LAAPGFCAELSVYRPSTQYNGHAAVVVAVEQSIQQLVTCPPALRPGCAPGYTPCCGPLYCIPGLGGCTSSGATPHWFCRDLNDPASCGGCGNACAPGTICSNGRCLRSCSGGLTNCNGACSDTTTDPLNCGGCGHRCPLGATCSNGQCDCSSGQTPCPNGICADLKDDPFNCGQCGNACPYPTPFGNLSQYANCCNGKCCPPDSNCCDGSCSDPLNDPANCGGCGIQCTTGQQCQSGVCVCQPVTGVPGGLGSKYNYLLGNGCQYILGLSVTFNVIQDIAIPSNGFSLQLNAWSPAEQTDAWQQYGFLVDPRDGIGGFINNWKDLQTALIDEWFDLHPLLPSSVLPAGYILKVSLQNDANGNVSGARYQVTDDHGNVVADKTKPQTAARAPIQNFSFVAVGPYDSESTTFTTGAASITYAVPSNSALTAQPGFPAGCPRTTFIAGTGETSNSTYGPLSACPVSSLTQSSLFG
jgi:Stigma-specific protein, Stig1